MMMGGKKSLVVMGAPFGQGQPLTGVEMAPQVLRERGLVSALEQLGLKVEDFGDIQGNGLDQEDHSPTRKNFLRVRNPHIVGAYCQHLAEVIRKKAEEKHHLLTIGGDHSIAMGTIGGLVKVAPNLKVIWIDAHADINTPRISPSGNLHGMPVAQLLGLIPREDLPEFRWMETYLKPENIVLIGPRSIDPGEREILDHNHIRYYTASDVKRMGIAQVLEETYAYLGGKEDQAYYLSCDVDALDPCFMASTGTKEDNGLSLEEVLEIAHSLSDAPGLLGMDLVELNPLIGTQQEVADSILATQKIVAAAFVGKGAHKFYTETAHEDEHKKFMNT